MQIRFTVNKTFSLSIYKAQIIPPPVTSCLHQRKAILINLIMETDYKYTQLRVSDAIKTCALDDLFAPYNN